jgi:hypothetical protein
MGTGSLADDARIAIALVNQLQAEANECRRQFEQQANLNLRWYLAMQWNAPPAPGLKQHVINLTRRAMLANVAVQMEQPPRPVFTAERSGRPAVFFIKEDAGRRLADVIEGGFNAVEGFTTDQLAGAEPIDEDQRAALMEIVAPGPQVPADPTIPTLAPVPLLTDDDFIRVDDAERAKMIQTAFEAKWDEIDADFIVLENVTDCAAVGWQPLSVQWNARRKGFDLVNLHQFNVWIDPLSTGVHNARYMIVEQVLSEDEALAKMPAHREAIRRAAAAGAVSNFYNRGNGGNQFNLGGPYRNTMFQRRMVVVRVAWLRDAQFEPLTPEQAVEQGFVEVVMPDPAIETPDLGAEAQPIAGDEAGAGPEPQYRMVETGEPITPDDERWPRRVGIRQITSVNQDLLSDMECPFIDIPVGWNRQIPRPKSPYGIGTPEHLRPYQEFLNTAFSIIANHLEYYQSPQESISESMAEALDDPETHAHPGRRYTVPDDLFIKMGGKVSIFAEPPALPESIVEAIRLVVELMDRDANQAEVLQGISPSGNASGELVKSLQAAAKGVIGLQSKYPEAMLTYIARIAAQAMIDFMPESEWVKATGLPVQVIRAMRAGFVDMTWDVVVEIASGRGADRRQRHDRALALYDRKLLSPADTLDALDEPEAKGKAQRAMEAFNPQAAMLGAG